MAHREVGETKDTQQESQLFAYGSFGKSGDFVHLFPHLREAVCASSLFSPGFFRGSTWVLLWATDCTLCCYIFCEVFWGLASLPHSPGASVLLHLFLHLQPQSICLLVSIHDCSLCLPQMFMWRLEAQCGLRPETLDTAGVWGLRSHPESHVWFLVFF